MLKIKLHSEWEPLNITRFPARNSSYSATTLRDPTQRKSTSLRNAFTRSALAGFTTRGGKRGRLVVHTNPQSGRRRTKKRRYHERLVAHKKVWSLQLGRAFQQQPIDPKPVTRYLETIYTAVAVFLY